jgi:hypothetical protein
VLEKVSQLLPPAAPMSEFERASIELQKEQLLLKQQELDSKKVEALAIAKTLNALVLERCKK